MNVIQYFRGDIPESYKRAMTTVLEKKPDNVDYVFETKLPKHIKKSVDPRFESDWFRIWWLLKHTKDVWLDCDVTIEKWFDFPDTGKPYFANIWGHVDTWIICPNGHIEVLEELLKLEVPADKAPSIIWCEWLYKHLNEISLIPPGYFKHK